MAKRGDDDQLDREIEAVAAEAAKPDPGKLRKKSTPRLHLPDDMKNHHAGGDVNAGTFTRVHLRVRAETRFGEELHCSGASYTMGQYKPSESIELVTSPEEYPVWRTVKPLILPRGIAHKYMYAVFSGGMFANWEPIDCDRHVVPQGRDMTISEDYGTFDLNSVLVPSASSSSVFVRAPASTASSTSKASSPSRQPASADAPVSSLSRSKSLQRFQRNKVKLQPRTASRDTPADFKPSNPDSTLFLVCYHLPIDIAKDPVTGIWTATWNKDSLIARSENSIAESMKVKWVGCITTEVSVSPPGGGRSTVVPMTDADIAAITAVLAAMDAFAVFLPPTLAHRHYQGYCKSKLWPMFHNVDILDIYSSVWEEDLHQANHDLWWESYTAVNSQLAHAVAAAAAPHDTVWAHDYHLLLFPKVLQDYFVSANKPRPHMVFFLHVPFPTSEIFRELSNGPALLEGVLAVDVVGFHTFDHARHFLNACKRFLGLTYQSQSGVNLGVDYKGRNVVIAISHVGIEKNLIQDAVHWPGVVAAATALRAKHKGKLLLAGVDVCQRLSGIPLKLLAFEQFFNQCPAWKDKLALVQRVHLTGSRQGDEAYSSHEIQQLVHRITASHGADVIDYEESTKPLALADRLALWLACDILIVTSIRGGLNLHPLEFVFAKGASKASDMHAKAGVVLLSEFSACCCVLNGGLRINPWNITEVVNSLDRAINMSNDERLGRRARDLPYITNQPASNWTKQVLSILQESLDIDADELSGALDFRKLDPIKIKHAYDASRRRVFLLDYGGTLIARENMPMYMKKDFTAVSGKIPTPRMLQALQTLCADPRNSVFVVSGVSQVNLTHVLGHIPSLGIAAHNGALFSWAKSIRFGTPNEDVQGNEGDPAPEDDTSTTRAWYHHRLVEYDWSPVRELVDPILRTYCSRTNGSVIRYMDQGIAWNFRSCDPEWGHLQSTSLQADLEDVLKDVPVAIVRKKGLLEIVPEGLHKGVVARHILTLDAETHGGHPDFIFSIGDDTTDETMFKAIYEHYAERSDESMHGRPDSTPSLHHVYTCTVGKKPSNAHLFVHHVDDVEELLHTLSSLP
ncbi:trehalose-phosphatase [Aphanomyces invadans]|uniref:Trehalose-phosphatase n=1 Tax=Aphanomyces invadans TaxID=157072 RepID=A0A024TBZ3_9STRA|nr:trehalose-phosphatase [Aphanomyces invadans]ETV90852.1 trehalose-phosphatase [Aphanomyces invadans]|eukprot:XP_008880530.1 trehalose-phosphatase [Aphanomyces invadans]